MQSKWLAGAALLVAFGIPANSWSQQSGAIDTQAAICAASAVVTGALTPSQAVCFLRFLSSLGKSSANTQEAVPLQRPQSLAEIGIMILKCYHPTGNFEAIELLDHPWREQHMQWNANNSALLRIRWHGTFGNRYATVVGLVERQGQIRTILQNDGAQVPASSHCRLNDWVQMSRS